jgi:hypothetical protein
VIEKFGEVSVALGSAALVARREPHPLKTKEINYDG